MPRFLPPGSQPPSSNHRPIWPTGALTAELDRVGVSFHKAGLADAVVAGKIGQLVWISVAAIEPRGDHSWEGREEEALELLARLPDGAGADAFWAVFACT